MIFIFCFRLLTAMIDSISWLVQDLLVPFYMTYVALMMTLLLILILNFCGCNGVQTTKMLRMELRAIFKGLINLNYLSLTYRV